MNMFDILTKLASIAGSEKSTALKEWGGDPNDLEVPSGKPDRDPNEERSELIDSWADSVIDEFEHYRNWDQMTDDQLERLSEIIAADLGAPEDIVHIIISGHASDAHHTDHSMRQGEMGNYKEDQGSQGDTGAHGEETISPVHGESMENDLTLESLKVLSGTNKTVNECGMTAMPMSGSHTPASINITASSGPELTGMLKDIMSLAGVSKVEPHHMPLASTPGPSAVISAPPMASADNEPSIKDILGKIDDIDTEVELDSMNDDEEETKESLPAGGFTHATTKPEPKIGPDGVRQFGDMNTGDHSDRMDGTAPRGHVKKETTESFIDSLYQDYQSFISESKPSAGMTKKEKSAVVKKAKAGGDIGKKGKGFEKVEKAAKAGGAKDPKAVAAAAMWKQQAKK